MIHLPTPKAFTGIALLIVCFMAVGCGEHQETPSDSSLPPGGYETATDDQLLQRAGTDTIYVLDADRAEAMGLPLRFQAEPVLEGHPQIPLSNLDYGPDDAAEQGTALFTYSSKDTRSQLKLFQECEQNTEKCGAGEDVVYQRGERGPMLVKHLSGGPWEARILIGKQLVYVYILGVEEYPPEDVVSLIRPLRSSR